VDESKIVHDRQEFHGGDMGDGVEIRKEDGVDVSGGPSCEIERPDSVADFVRGSINDPTRIRSCDMWEMASRAEESARVEQVFCVWVAGKKMAYELFRKDAHSASWRRCLETAEIEEDAHSGRLGGNVRLVSRLYFPFKRGPEYRCIELLCMASDTRMIPVASHAEAEDGIGECLP
jgi:hypothetical protein